MVVIFRGGSKAALKYHAEVPLETETVSLAIATCAAIGCDKVDMTKSCLCTTRCSSHTPPNCCPDYHAVCALNPPAAGPGAKIWNKIVPGFNSEGVQCIEGPLPVIWQHNAGALPGMELNVLSYNLEWYRTFQVGNSDGITTLIISKMQSKPFDVMGFQECEDEVLLFQKLGVANYYTVFRDRAICIAFRRDTWQLLVRGRASIAADLKFGKRAVQFLRLRHTQTGRMVFVMNHHGPIPVDVGGICGGASVAYELLQLVKTRAQPGDAVLSFGDFNANPASVEIRSVAQRLHLDFSGTTVYNSQLDHIFSNIPQTALVRGENLGMGGSDHNAISAVYKLGTGPPVQAPPMALPMAPAQSTTTLLSTPEQEETEQEETEQEETEQEETDWEIDTTQPLPLMTAPPSIAPQTQPQNRLQSIISHIRQDIDGFRQKLHR